MLHNVLQDLLSRRERATPELFQEALLEMMDAEGWTARDVACRYDVSVPSVERWRAGVTRPLGVIMFYLFEDWVRLLRDQN